MCQEKLVKRDAAVPRAKCLSGKAKLGSLLGNALWRNEELLHKASHNELSNIAALAESALSVGFALIQQEPTTDSSVQTICCNGSSY